MHEDDRPKWEYADGPVVGVDVPITGEPRAEDAPGVPARTRRPESPARLDGRGRRDGGSELEEREVTVRDPTLSERANEQLTQEVREVVGRDRVTVPSDRPRPSRGERPPRRGALDLEGHSLMLLRTFAAALVVGAIISLVTGSWWFLPLAAGLHALGTMSVIALSVRMTMVRERPAPTTVAMLDEEGVRNPEEHFSSIVEEFTERRDPQPHGDTVIPDRAERTVEADVDPALAAQQQVAAMTPTGGVSAAAGGGGLPDALIWWVVLGCAALSIILPAVAGGGWLWLTSAVVIPLVIGFVLLQLLLHGGTRTSLSPRAIASWIVCGTTIAVAGFCAVVALALQH